MSKASEMVLYRTCKRMIQRGTIDGLAETVSYTHLTLPTKLEV